MTTAAVQTGTVVDVSAPRAGAASRLGFIPAATVFLSAFLLFQLQPLIGKYILPWFGGAPGVWNTCLLFFQVVLLAGYAYAHLVVSRLAPRKAAILHAALLLVACATLPILPAERWKPSDPLNPTGRIILLLAATVGLPYFALATTAPLLQAWVARIDPRVATYRLYALSNGASLLALVSYPFAVEPVLSRREQAWVWSGLFALFAAGCAYCAVRAMRVMPHTAASDLEAGHVEDAPVSPWQRALWVALPACASALLLGTTNTLTQDVAPAPFLWVLPLALYLLTFVIAFDRPRWYARRVVGPLLIAAAGAMVWAMYLPLDIPIARQVPIYCAGLLVVCLMCHGELARLRPHPRRLTDYYLAIAAGGALGAALVTIVAPLLFTRHAEFGLSLFACCVLLLVVMATDPRSRYHGLRRPLAWVGMIVATTLLGYAVWMAEPVERGTVLVEQSRNFYGVLRVRETDPAAAAATPLRVRGLYHGQVLHGSQPLDEPLRHRPISYYGPRSGVAEAVRRLDDRPSRRVGVIGLGVGSVAALMRAGDSVRFYEINPDVLRVAREHFTYLRDSPADVEVILGDARLSLEREPPQRFDLLVLDAFSGDAIPIHLLTAEAFAIYRAHLREDGLLVVHISNRHLDLRPVVAAAARALNMRAAFVSRDATEPGERSSTWAILDRGEGQPLAPGAPGGKEILWTDDRADLLSILKRPGAKD